MPPSGASDLPGASASADAGDSSLADAIAVLRKRGWIILIAIVLGFGYGFYKAKNQPRVYESYGTIQVRSGSSNAYKVDPTGFEIDPYTKMNTEVAILKSETLLIAVARELNLQNSPEFFGVPPGMHLSMDDPAVRQAVLQSLGGSLSVSLVPKTEMIHISYTGNTAKLSADIVNEVIKAYIERSYETRFASTQRVSQWLSGQLDDLKQQVETSQEQMMELQRRLGVLGFDSTHSELTGTLNELLAAEGAATIARITAESRYRMINGMDPDTLGSSIETTPLTAPGSLTGLRQQLNAAKTQYAQLTSERGLGPNHPQALALTAQINQLTKELAAEQNRLIVQARESYLAAKATEEKTQQELDATKGQSYKQRDDLVEYSLRQREYEQNRALYDGLQQRLRTAGVQAGLESLEVDVVDQALPAALPTLASTTSIIISTSLFFILGALVLIFVLEGLDTGIHNIAEIESLMELPSLAIVPRSKRTTADQTGMSMVQRNINVLTQPKSQFTEAFRSLRTSLLLSTTGQPPKFILFTSATPSEGKTTTASNLACVLAQRDARVLLIDADLRRPNVHHRFGLTGKLGLTTLLAGTSTLEESLQHVPEIPYLDILPSGPVPPFPTEMLSSQAMSALLERLGGMYTHVVIDSPPILSVTDGVILAQLVDAVVLVIRHGKSTKNVIRRARDLLVRSHAPIAGIVLNAIDLNSPDYYGYYGYSGYAYSSVDTDSWDTNAKPATETGKKGGPRDV